jgi:hypothetical protein
MQIQTKHRDRLRAVIRERLFRFRIDRLKTPPSGPKDLDDHLYWLMRDLEREALNVLKVPTKKKPRR